MPSRARRFIAELAADLREDDVFNGAAALGFWLTLSLFPALIFVMALLPYLPIANLDRALADLIAQAMPAEAARLVTGVVGEILARQHGGLLSFGLLGTLWAGSTGLYAIMQQLNRTYKVREGRSFLKARATALGLALLFAALILGAFSLIVLGGVLQNWLGAHWGDRPLTVAAFAYARWAVIVAALLLAFALTYYFGPDVEQRFRYVTPGSVAGVALLIAASLAFKLYTARFAHYDASYGSLGAVIVLMFWLYLAGLMLLLGSEINAVSERHSPRGKDRGEKQVH